MEALRSRRHILVLMYKHALVRKRRFIHTFIEILSPSVLFLLMYWLWESFLYAPAITEQLIMNPINVYATPSIKIIYYCPYSEKAQSLVKSAAQAMQIKDANIISAKNEVELLQKFQNSELDGLLGTAGVIFKNDLKATAWPKQLTYTIRLEAPYHTMSASAEMAADAELDFIYRPFVALQWGIDKAFIMKSTNKNLAQEFTVQPFPRPKSARNEQARVTSTILKICAIMSPMTFFAFTGVRLSHERCSGIKEMIKMVGVSSFSLQMSHIINSMPACAVYVWVGTLLPTISGMLPGSSKLLLAILLLLYFFYYIALAYLCSTLLNSPGKIVTVSFVVYGATLASGLLSGLVKPTSPFFILTGLLPHEPVMWYFAETTKLLTNNHGPTLSNMHEKHAIESCSVLAALICLLLQVILMSCFALYMEQVRPGQYGVARRWDFPLKWIKKGKKNVLPELHSELEQAEHKAGEHFETIPGNSEVGIKVVNVSKVFGGWTESKIIALKNVNLDILKGEITVLLGHNGAGKSTLMAIITGMYSPTGGQVFVKGLNIEDNLTQIRKSIGLCPQHNLTFGDLTVQENIMFFAMLKGLKYKEAKSQCSALLARLQLSEKAKNMSGQLSGGMKRRLQLGCALAGGSEVLILDEPTSGLDVETRREMWDLMLSLRGERTILLTTHFMEEADALGDRVAALHGGTIRCHATPMFLKQSIGSGYRLSLTLDPGYPRQNIVGLVTSTVHDAQLQEEGLTSMSFSLPSKDTGSFPKLFDRLEAQRAELGIRSMGVGVTTLEEVFLKLCSDDPGSVGETKATYASGNDPEGARDRAPYERMTGMPLAVQQFKVLFKRQCRYVLRKKYTFLILEILLPIAGMALANWYVTNKTNNNDENPPRAMNLDLYKDIGASTVFYNPYKLSGDLTEPFKSRYGKFKFTKTNNVINEILRVGNKNMEDYEKLVIAVELNDTKANALYTTRVRHAMPVSVNVLSNMLLKLNSDKSDSHITTINHPIMSGNEVLIQLDDYNTPKSAENCSQWPTWMTGCLCLLMIPMIAIASMERQSSVRHIRIMSGVPALLYLLPMWLFHMAVFTATGALCLVLFTGLLDTDKTFDNAGFLFSIFFFVLFHAVAFLVFIYLVSYFSTEAGGSSFLILMVAIFAFILVPIGGIMEVFDSPMLLVLKLGNVFPPAILVAGLEELAKTARLNAWCELNKKSCPDHIDVLRKSIAGFPQDCCSHEGRFGALNYLTWDVGKLYLLLIGEILVYGVIVVLLETGAFNRWWNRICNRTYAPPAPHYHDQRVDAEKLYVDSTVRSGDPKLVTTGQDTALIHDLHMRYPSVFGKAFTAVKGVNFSVKHGECFGLLGVNGAGKSSVFKMLTGSEHPTRGNVFANGYSLKGSRKAYLSTMTYCPQFGGVDNFLSGADNIELSVLLRGVPPKHAEAEVHTWTDLFDLGRMGSRPVSAYSGGYIRRAATATALAGAGCGAGDRERRTALLDEPTSGVDPAARRQVWTALRHGLQQGLSIIITSHSMDETEALCSRIAIMSRGELGTLGTAPELRATHATGYRARLKLHAPATPDPQSPGGSPGPAQSDAYQNDVNNLKEYMLSHFSCELKDEHKTMLDYRIDSDIGYSQLFTRMEGVKQRYRQLLEDYTISETTLEEVFLSFAKDAHV